jgi:hypothetical protein
MTVNASETATTRDRALRRKVIGRAHASRLTGADTQWVLGETQANPGLVTVGELVSIKLIERFTSHGHFVEFNETHGTILLVPEAQALVSALFGEESLQLLFGGVWRKVTNIEGIAGRIQVVRIRRGKTMTRSMLITIRVSMTSHHSIAVDSLRKGGGRRRDPHAP